MDWTAWLVVLAIVGMSGFLVRHVGINLSATSVLLSLLLLLHGPAYLYYTRVWGPETDFFDRIMSAAPGEPVIASLDIALAVLFLCVCVGVKLTDLLTATTGRQMRLAISRWGAAPVVYSATDRTRLWGLVVASIIFMLPFVFIDQQLPKVLEYFTSNLGEVEKIALRREGGGSSVYVYNLLTSSFFPFVAFCIVAARGLGSRRDSVIFCVFFCLLVLSKAATLSKAPLAVLFVQLAVVFFMRRSLQVSTQTVTWLLGLSAAAFMAMASVANPEVSGAAESIEFMFYRVFMIVNESLVEYFAAIPYAIDHSWGTQFSWIATLFQSEPRLPTFWLVGEVHRGEIGSTTTVMFIGDAWADFAWAGVVLSAFFAGLLARWIDIQLIVNRGKSVFSAAGLGLGHFGVFIALSTSLQTALITGGLLLVIPLVNLLSSVPVRTASERHSVRITPSGEIN